MPAGEFVALADLLRGPALSPQPEETIAEKQMPAEAEPHSNVSQEMIAAARDAKLFRARLADAFEAASARLLRELAIAVLARELTIAPCDLAALARGALERAPFVRLRIAPEDGGRDYGIATIVDPTLDQGDAVFELCGGALDARLGVRLAGILEEKR